MSRLRWQLLLAAALLVASGLTYTAQVLIFRNPHETQFLLFQDLAFLPLHVLVVTMILDQLLHMREKRSMLNKMNMVIGVFFSEVGTHILKSILIFDQNIEKIRSDLLVTDQWTGEQFSAAIKNIHQHRYHINYAKHDLEALKTFLNKRREFLLRLLENPNLLEHETFTDLLWAVFHLAEELAMRPDLTNLTPQDETHIAGDVRRAYTALITQWLAYMRHLKKEYPYLFSLALRMNPLDPAAHVDVRC